MAILNCTAVALPRKHIQVLWEAPNVNDEPDPDVDACTLWQLDGPAITLTDWQAEWMKIAAGRADTYAVVFTPDPGANPDLGWLRPGEFIQFDFELGHGGEAAITTVQPAPDGMAAGFETVKDQLDSVNLNTLRARASQGSLGQELLDGAGMVGGGVRGARDDLQDLLGYPLLIQGADGSGPAAPSGTPGGQALVDAEIRRVLGRKPSTEDVPGTLALLDRAMRQVEQDGVQRWDVRPGGAHATQADTGAGVTGRQASLASLARDTLEQIRPLVDQVSAVAPSTSNPGLLDVHRHGFVASLTDAVNEASVPGGPLKLKAQVLLDQSLAELARFGRELRVLRRRKRDGKYFPTRKNVLTPHDEDHFTKFLVIVDRYVVFDAFYRTFLGREPGRAPAHEDVLDLSGVRPDADRGKSFTTLDWIVSVIDEGVRELDTALDSVGVGAEERKVYLVRKDGGTLAELMEWADQFPEHEARPLITNGGIRGAQLLPDRLTQLHAAFTTLRDQVNSPDGRVPRELRQHRVRRAVEKLVRELDQARDAAERATN